MIKLSLLRQIVAARRAQQLCSSIIFSFFIAYILMKGSNWSYNVNRGPKMDPNLRKLLKDQHLKRVRWQAWTAWEEPSCRVPYLSPFDENIRKLITHPEPLACPQVMPDLAWIDQNGYLHIDRKRFLMERQKIVPKNPNIFGIFGNYGSTIFGNRKPIEELYCAYRYIGGSLGRNRTHVDFISPKWEIITSSPFYLTRDQLVVRCLLLNSSLISSPKIDLNNLDFTGKTHPLLYDKVHANIGPIPESDTDPGPKKFRPASEKFPSLMLLGIDSVSLNQFRRHMPLTKALLKNSEQLRGSEAIFLETYMKVGDNSLPNMLPLLTGLRVHDQSPELPTDFTEESNGRQIQIDDLPWIWNRFRDAGCATLYDDDVKHYGRGLFHYPFDTVSGFNYPPTHHYLRPYWVYLRKALSSSNATLPHCYANSPIFDGQLKILEKFTAKYADACRFSFTFLPDVAHEKPEDLELLDSKLEQFIANLRDIGALNDTILLMFGDHGHRVGPIKFSYIGKLEARLPLMAFLLPPKWVKSYPEAVEQLRRNSHRLTSNFDVYRTLDEIFGPKYSGYPNLSTTEFTTQKSISYTDKLKLLSFGNLHSDTVSKISYNNINKNKTHRNNNKQNNNYDKIVHGQSLFTPISLSRSCLDAGVPPQFCTCLQDLGASPLSNEDYTAAQRALQAQITYLLRYEPRCKVSKLITITNITVMQVNHRVLNDDRSFVDYSQIEGIKSGQTPKNFARGESLADTSKNAKYSTNITALPTAKYANEAKSAQSLTTYTGNRPPIVFLEVTAILQPSQLRIKAIVQNNLRLKLLKINGPIRVVNRTDDKKCSELVSKIPLCYC